MNKSRDDVVSHPYDTANFFSKWIFYWTWKYLFYFRKGFKVCTFLCTKSEISANFIPELICNEKMQRLSLWKTLLRSYGQQFFVLCLPLAFSECILKPAQAICLWHFLESVRNDNSIHSHTYAGVILLLAFTVTFINQPINFAFQRIASKCRVACSKLIYGQILGMNAKSLQNANIGKISNMLGNDVGRFDQSLKFLPYIVIVPIQCIVYSYLLWNNVGVVVLAGLGIVYTVAPLQYFNGKLTSKLRVKISEHVDKRCKLMSEIVGAIRVIKMYAWEEYFISTVNIIRRGETLLLQRRFYLKGVYSTMYSSLSKLIPFVTILWYIETENTFDVTKVFFLIACFNTMIQSATYTFPLAVSSAGELLISVERIQSFLVRENQEEKKKIKNDKCVTKVEMENVSASWNGISSHIGRADLKLTNNMLVYITGPNGSGKSSLLGTMLGELDITDGKLSVDGRFAYSSQKPWIFPGSIRDNILIGRPYLENRYQHVIEAACLLRDMKLMPHGDLTVVGENGAGLSGGQCSRISLARCIYQEAEIYLLDEPFSALDSKVSADVFKYCARRFLCDKLRIVVSNQTAMAQYADHVLIMDQGRIAAQGIPAEVSLSFPQYFRETNKHKKLVDRKLSAVDSAVTETRFPASSVADSDESSLEQKCVPRSFRLISKYLASAKSKPLFFCVVVSILVTQSGASGAEYWVSYLSYEMERGSELSHTQMLLEIYGGLVGVVIVGNILQTALFFWYCTRAARNIHVKMINGLMSISTGFFDSNVSGVIFNRFTKDLMSVDELLPSSIFDMCVIFLQMGVSLAMIIIADNYMAIATSILILVLFLLRKFYIKTAKLIREREISAKSPVFSHVVYTVQGLLTIRSSSAQEFFSSQFDTLQDVYSSAWFMSIAAARGFGMGIEFVCNIFVTVLVMTILLAKSGNSGSIGLAMTSALSLSSWLQQALRLSSDVESLLVPVGKLLELSKLEPECSITSSRELNSIANWPSEGRVSFVNVSMSYNDTRVLSNVTFEVKPKEKIGIVGRTGAGKSSIVQALFRMTSTSGHILIDGVNIENVGLTELRRSMAIIPQNHVVFSGSLRDNLDPFHQQPDDVLWCALTNVKLAHHFISLDGRVDEEIVLSGGLKQLISVARAIIENKKIIVMDEATSDIDNETDDLIQQTIKELFAQSTMIIITHRLNTVIDCDRILVLDAGVVKEYGTPEELLRIPDGYFTSLMKAQDY